MKLPDNLRRAIEETPRDWRINEQRRIVRLGGMVRRPKQCPLTAPLDLPEDEYRAWIETMKQEQAKARGESDKTFSKDELIAKGEQVYIGTCVACHMANGQGLPPAFPALVGGAITTGPISEHLNRVLNGKPGTAMQAFGEQLSDADIAAVITYERNSWGNAEQLAGEADLVQPAEVKAAKSMASM